MRFFVVLLFLHSVSFAQYTTKKVIVNGSGPPLVLLAGGRWDMQSFSDPATSLGSTHRVIRMEHFNVQYANNGLLLPAGYSLKKESDAIGSTLDSLGIKHPVVLVGWSFGALMAMDFALNYPERVSKLVLYEPPAFWLAHAKGESPENMETMIQLTKAFTPQASITEAQLAAFRCLLDKCDTAEIRNHPQWQVWASRKDRLRGLSVVANHVDTITRLQSFKQPVLILTGKGTVKFHRRINELLNNEFPNSSLIEIAGGHSAPQEAVREFIDVVSGFIRRDRPDLP